MPRLVWGSRVALPRPRLAWRSGGQLCPGRGSTGVETGPERESEPNLGHYKDSVIKVAQSELQKLTEYANSKGHEGNLEPFDTLFWSERQYEELYSLKEEEARSYFPLDKVLSGSFKLCSELFEITIKAADGEAEVWDPTVRFFKVYDENANHIASFYLDPYSRPGEKATGAWVGSIYTRSRLLKTIPLPILIINLRPPVGSAPSLLSFEEAKTLFHEFGHVLQFVLSTVEHASVSGVSNIEWDAVEIASLAWENWIYDWDTISSMSGHYQTNASFPHEMFQKLLQARHFRGGSKMQNQVYLSALDMELHTSTDSLEEVTKRVKATYAIPDALPEDCLMAENTHIFGGAYAAGYYTYLWSDLLAQDEFEEFSAVGLENRDDIKKVGQRFRDTVLSMATGTHPMEVFKKFTSRDPTPAALFRKYGF